MTLLTPTLTKRSGPAIVPAILGRIKGTAAPASPAPDNTVYQEAVDTARADLLKAGQKDLALTAQKMLAIAVRDYSGV